MTRLEELCALLHRHRYAGGWEDVNVATDILTLYNIPPDQIVAPTQLEIDEAEAAHKDAADRLAALKAAQVREKEIGDRKQADDVAAAKMTEAFATKPADVVAEAAPVESV